MIETVDRYLVDWLSDATNGTRVALAPPSTNGSPEALNLHLLDLLPTEPIQSRRRHPLQVLLRYLVTATASDVTQSHALLGQAAVAALEHPEIDPEFKEIGSDVWRAFSVLPQPGFFLRAPLSIADTQPGLPTVSQQPEVVLGSLVVLHGKLVGPGQRVIPRATISLPELNQSTKTDDHGDFTFPGVSSKPERKHLRIHAKGQEQDVEISILDRPLIVEFEPKDL